MPPPSRRPVIDLRATIAAREPLVVNMDRINAIDSDTRRFLRHLRTWVDSHKRELSEIEEAHVASVQQSLQTVRATKAEIEETKTAVEELIGSEYFTSAHCGRVREES